MRMSVRSIPLSTVHSNGYFIQLLFWKLGQMLEFVRIEMFLITSKLLWSTIKGENKVIKRSRALTLPFIHSQVTLLSSDSLNSEHR